MASRVGAIRAGRAFVEIFADNTKLTKGSQDSRCQAEGVWHNGSDDGPLDANDRSHGCVPYCNGYSHVPSVR